MRMKTGARSQKPEARSSDPDFRKPAMLLQPSAFSLQPSRRGVALIITLILLSVVLFMALTFMALSRRERGAVATVTDTASARFAADAALANAEAQIVANVLSATNPYNFGLLVSTNYINPAGFHIGIGNLTNVSYVYANGTPTPGALVNGNDLLQLLANLYYNPRPPVFIPTNNLGSNDFRYYLDLNRNGRYDTNGWVTNVDNLFNGTGTTNFQVGDPEWIGILQHPDQPYGPDNPFVARYAFIAVPVGNTLDLNAIHNQALIMVRNYSTNNLPNYLSDGYFRNQGVGSWEINLAAFLADLNTNEWDPQLGGGGNAYQYLQIGVPYLSNAGYAFMDAAAILSYRYNYNYGTLSSVDSLFGGVSSAGHVAFINDGIDGYSDGPLQITFNTNEISVSDVPGRPWAGADNVNHYFNHQELFNSNEISPQFVGNLLYTGQTNSTYDRYTFYRLLSQLGTDTTPESGRMNLNYDNLDRGSNGFLNVNGTASATNFVPWTPLGFFTNAADRLLRAYTARWRDANLTNFATAFYAAQPVDFITNSPDVWANWPAFGLSATPGGPPGIPVLVSNQVVYSSAVNRLLQLAANLYDATTTNFYPSVFRPLFSRMTYPGFATNIYITGYTNVGPFLNGSFNVNNPPFDPPVDLAFLTTTNLPGPVNFVNLPVNVYGVPWIIGAKKGLPNFNEFVMENIVSVTRRLQVTLDNSKLAGTNQMYLIGLNSLLGLDLWNSYSNTYFGSVQGLARENLSISLTNDDPGFNLHPGVAQPMGISPVGSIFSGSWTGAWPAPAIGQANANSFIIPLNSTNVMLTNSIYRTPNASMTPGTLPAGFVGACFVPTNYTSVLTAVYETNRPANTPRFPFPNFGLLTTNQLQVFMFDQNGSFYYVIDYAHFEQISSRNLNSEIFCDDLDGNNQGVWNTNIDSNTGVPFGIENQLNISRGISPLPGEDGTWKPDPQAQLAGGSTTSQQTKFNQFFLPGLSTPSNSIQAPYSPTRYGVGFTVLEANDPLVHYFASDMNPSYMQRSVTNHYDYNSPSPSLSDLDLGQLNSNYQPWGGGSSAVGLSPGDTTSWTARTAYNAAIKDPLVWSSDNWDFPYRKLPTVGWIGRVHRGTAWQSVYLKATDILNVNVVAPSGTYYGTNLWTVWTGEPGMYDAFGSSPVQDRLLFDLFTTALDDNATRGTLSVNQSATSTDPLAGLAAWSALFSGLVTVSNNIPDGGTSLTLHPQRNFPAPAYTTNIIQPAGPFPLISPLGIIVTNINWVRTNFVNADGVKGTFEHVGDILSVPQLTEQSPFLHVANNGIVDFVQLTNGISDEMYEWLPQQAMSLLRCSASPRYVIYCYGQALKPAPDGVNESSVTLANGQSAFGMITNYQVVSEIATRAVVRFGTMVTNVATYNVINNVTNWYTVPVVTNNSAVLEQFNLLPPD